MKKKQIKTVFALIAVILIGGISMLHFLGKPLEVETDKKLEGVDETICDVLYCASLAANSHNTQSWKVELNIDKQQISISIDEERTLDVVDSEHRELYISLGCYIEAMTYSFDAYGYDTTVVYKPTSDRNHAVAMISYLPRQNAEINHNQIETIKKRHTDKASYKTDKLNPTAVNELLGSSTGIYCYEIGSEEFEYLKQGTLEAITKQSLQSEYRQELNVWMRFSDKEVQYKKDGISAEMIGLNGIVKTFYYLTTNHGNAEKDTFANQGIDTAKKQVENCSAFFIIAGDNSMIDWIEAGRKTQAFWYECVEQNISVQPLSAMLEAAPFDEEIQDNLGIAQKAQMILRVGYVENYGENAGVRRNLNEYITVIDGD